MCCSNLVEEKSVPVSTVLGKLRLREPGLAGKFATNNETSRRRLATPRVGFKQMGDWIGGIINSCRLVNWYSAPIGY